MYFLMILLLSSTCLLSDGYLTFEDPNIDHFNHIIVHDYTERVYIGAVNRIYQLSRDLKEENAAVMGPLDDSAKCPVTRVCPTEPKLPTDYYNKALVIDYFHGKLIACGSLFQGICTVHDLNDVALYETPANESVVANDATASTVAFIAPGPKNSPRSHVLYVGVSYTGNGPYRSDVPAVSSRILDPSNMFVIAHTSFTTGTKMMLNSMFREIYPITYIYGFSSKGFSYFVTVQKLSTDRPNTFISKLVRVCQKDVHYYSYTEVPLVCRAADGTDYNLVQAAFVGTPGSELAKSLGISAQVNVLFAVFAKSKDEADIYNKPSPNSALCVYALSAVQRKFTQNIQHCFNGNGERGLDFINPSEPCYPTRLQISDNFCGLDVNTPTGGNLPIEAAPVLHFSGILLTAVTATSTNDYTTVFMGTSTGHLKRAIIETATKAREYNDTVIDNGSPVNADMVFDKTKSYLYVMTEKKITKVKVQECHVFHSCIDCLRAYEPYCGWCPSENKCSTRSECSEAFQDLHSVWFKSGNCTTITEVHPHQIQRTTADVELYLVINNLPVLEEQFFCRFKAFDKVLITKAARKRNGINCPNPHSDSLPPNPTGEHHFTAKLSVRLETGSDLVATNFTFYDCSSYTSCTQCVSSDFPCDWCVDGNRCTHDTGENCRNDVLITGVSNIGPSIRSGPEFCPYIKTYHDSTENLVASGLSKRVSVKLYNIMHIANMKFLCQFIIEGHVKQVTAQLLGDVIYCNEMLFSYSTQAPNITAAFSVIWDGNKLLDNPEKFHVLIYKCSDMAHNCSTCVDLPGKYVCGWCKENGGSCQVHEHCNHLPTLWLVRKQTCPNPQITSFSSQFDLWKGGINFTITGTNLRQIFSSLSGGISVIHNDGKLIANCIPHPELHVGTTNIVCHLEGLQNLTTISGPITGLVETSVLYDISQSKDPHSSVDSQIISFKPNIGPKSGGTTLEIWGLHMDAGNTVEAFVGELPCNITSHHYNQIICITSASKDETIETIRIKFDDDLRVFEDYKFHYVEDPEIIFVESGPISERGIPKGIPSGGLTISVKGYNLNAVTTPYIYVVLDDKEYNNTCEVESPAEMKCKSPYVPLEKLKFFSDDAITHPIELDYGFKMDYVTRVQNLSNHPRFSKFMIFPDPVYYPFSEKNKIKHFRSDYLTINGKDLDRASHITDIKVQIGTSLCLITSLSHSQLTCKPPARQPAAKNENGNPDLQQLLQVMVMVGSNLTFIIGKLSYVLEPAFLL